MTTSVSTFTYSPLDRDTPVTKVRTLLLDGEPWFVAIDVARALDLYVDSGCNTLVRRLAADEKRVISRRDHATDTWCSSGLFQKQQAHLTLISESGLYKLIMRSDLATAKPFQDWVTKEVLPSIRKTGSYGLAN